MRGSPSSLSRNCDVVTRIESPTQTRAGGSKIAASLLEASANSLGQRSKALEADGAEPPPRPSSPLAPRSSSKEGQALYRLAVRPKHPQKRSIELGLVQDEADAVHTVLGQTQSERLARIDDLAGPSELGRNQRHGPSSTPS